MRMGVGVGSGMVHTIWSDEDAVFLTEAGKKQNFAALNRDRLHFFT
jgi:hypothetical protein